jgi:hypothetical protein
MVHVYIKLKGLHTTIGIPNFRKAFWPLVNLSPSLLLQTDHDHAAILFWYWAILHLISDIVIRIFILEKLPTNFKDVEQTHLVSIRINSVKYVNYANVIVTRQKSHLVSCNKFVNKFSSHCLSQIVNKFGTSCQQSVTTLLILSDVLQVAPTSPIQSWYNNIVTTLCRQPCNILVISWLYQTC